MPLPYRWKHPPKKEEVETKKQVLIALRVHPYQKAYLQAQPNQSQFIKDLIDEAIEKERLK